jgi:hypothetical protein
VHGLAEEAFEVATGVLRHGGGHGEAGLLHIGLVQADESLLGGQQQGLLLGGVPLDQRFRLPDGLDQGIGGPTPLFAQVEQAVVLPGGQRFVAKGSL